MLHKSKLMLPILAVIVGISASAFTVKGSQKLPNDVKNFTYNDFPNDEFIADPSHYTLTGNDGSNPLTCPGGAHRCGVQAEEDASGQPILSGATVFTADEQ